MNVYLAARGAELQPGLTALSAFKLLLYFLGVALKTVDKNVFNLVNKAFSLAQKRAEKEEDVSCGCVCLDIILICVLVYFLVPLLLLFHHSKE